MKLEIKQINYWLSVATLGVVLGFGISQVRAWSNPIDVPPAGNVTGAPITTGASQTKSGGLGLGSLIVTNGVQLMGRANCDLKTTADGTLSCGTDAAGGSDNLGNHTATATLSMVGNRIERVGNLDFESGSGIQTDGNVVYIGRQGARFNGSGLSATYLFGQGKVSSPSICFTNISQSFESCRTSWPVADNLGSHIADLDLNMNAKKITGLAAPTAGTDGVNKDYVDQGMNSRKFCRAIAAVPSFAAPTNSWENNLSVPMSWTIDNCRAMGQARFSMFTPSTLQWRYLVGCVNANGISYTQSNPIGGGGAGGAISAPNPNCGW